MVLEGYGDPRATSSLAPDQGYARHRCLSAFFIWLLKAAATGVLHKMRSAGMLARAPTSTEVREATRWASLANR